ncbi:MFS transporter [Altererythrobacter soli]|uniref:MFS transporter n=1 Tax=Croceibacterium soli TaxID=1739690 RepID=A0A6I4UVA7_9SPHN|nr:MFS transporter [Croceibacterium soli]MXP42568.1 MFS transporter [Croceibacterium soli]
MLSAVSSVRSLLLAIFMLMSGAGFMATLLGVRLERAGSSALTVGIVGTAYFLGLVLGSTKAGLLVARVGHIRAFAAFVSLFSASTLSYALFRDPIFWASLRLIDGLCVAGVYVCLESWLNERAQEGSRGSVLAAYMIALYLGQAAGQFLLNISDVKPSLPFIAASILISVSAIPIALTRIDAPSLPSSETLSMRALYAISPLGVVGAALTGAMLGAFYSLGAVYARRLGMELSLIAVFMSTVIFGGVALQWPLGILSDRFDRRRVIVIAFAGTLLAGLATALTREPGLPLLAFGALFGGLSFALYPLCVAHANDHLLPDQRVAASGGLVLTYSAGAAAGPLVAAVFMTAAGTAGLFLFISTCAGAALLFGIWRQALTPPVPAEQQQTYQILPRTTPVSAALDPLAPNDPEEVP